MNNQVEYIPIAEEKQETPIQTARRRFEYWYGQEVAKALYTEIACMPEVEQVEMIYREMEYRDSVAYHAESAHLCAVGMGV